jgi:hypothetical protein
MLGHQNFNTTLIYAEIPTEELRHRVNAVTTSPKKWYKNCICSWSRILGAAYNMILPNHISPLAEIPN